MHIKLISLGLISVFALISLGAKGANSQYSASIEARNSLRRALDRGRVQHYTIWQEGKAAEVLAARYESSNRITFEPRGMGPLYNATHVILNSVLGDEAFPEGLISVNPNHELVVRDDLLEQWPSLLQHYAALITIIIVGVLLAVITPIVGFCFCCCRCAGSCGARSQPFDKKHDTCRRVFLGLFLIFVATAMLFGVVVAFVTNSYMQEGVEQVPSAARFITNDTAVYLNDTSNHMRHLLIENFSELRDSLMNILNESARVVTEELASVSKAVSLAQLENIVGRLPAVQINLLQMNTATRDLRINASQLNDGLRRVKRELLRSLNDCNKQACKEVLQKYEIGTLDTSGIDFNQLPNPQEVLQDLEQFVNGNLQNEIQDGLDQFNSIKDTFDKAVDQNIQPIEESINKAGDEIRQQSNKLMSTLDNIGGTTNTEGEKMIKIADDYIKEYSKYRYYAGLVLSGILLLVLVCVSFGLLCGICGKRPDGYGDDCCNKGAGSSFLMCAVAIMFLSTAILAVVALVHFIVGLLVHRAVCVPLSNPTNDQIFGLFDDLVDLDKIIYSKSKLDATPQDTYALSRIIEDCHANKSAYEVFKLDHVLNDESIDDLLGYVERFHISDQLKKLLDEFKMTSNIDIINQNTREELIKLQNSPLNDFQFYQYTDTLSENITSVNLSDLADKLEETASQIARAHDTDYIEVIQNLRNQALVLRSYQDNLVAPMVIKTVFLKDVAADLEISLKFNRSSFSEAIRSLTEEIDYAQDFLREQGPAFVEEMVHELGHEVENDIKKYLNHVVVQTKTKVGQCGPLSSAYNATLVAVCNNVLDPFNGFWAGLGWCILLFIPCIILSVKLSGLYQKSDPYPGPLVESEYLYDAYADRDNISLTSPPESKRRSKEHKNERNAHRELNTQGPSASHDDRYTDMARKSTNSNACNAVSNNSPKNEQNSADVDNRWTQYNGSHHIQWDDYSEDAPPRYHSPPLPPSEYERPPPYYYPGPTGERSSSAN